MRVARAVSIGVLAVTVTGACQAQTSVLEFPLDRQVFQRNGEEWAEVKVSGTGPKDAALVEAKATLAAGLRGEALAWTVVARGEQIKDGRFDSSVKLVTGGIVGSPDYRHDGIHFGPRGLLIHAERWYAALSAHYHLANPLTGVRK